MNNQVSITTKQVKHIADLASIPISKKEESELQHAFEEILKTVSDLQSVDVEGVDPTHQVTGLENRLREDIVDEKNMLTQEEALKNAPKTFDGYFVVPRIIEEK